ncbi:hypothetical protein ACW2AB_04810 [Limosilactobacillus fermentum]
MEKVVEWVLDSMPADKELKVLDLGTAERGNWYYLALERPSWQVTLVTFRRPP